MEFSVVIPTNRDPDDLTRILNSLSHQTVQPTSVFLIVDKVFHSIEEKNNYKKGIMQKKGSEKLTMILDKEDGFHAGKGVSAARNFGIQKVQTPYVQLFDDDIQFLPDFFEKQQSLYEYRKNIIHKEYILIPQIMYADTRKVRSYGIRYFNYFMGRPIPFSIDKKKKRKNLMPQMCASVSLFGQTKHFQSLPYDEEFKFIMEDYDASHNWFRNGIPLIVDTSNTLEHRERPKKGLEKYYLQTPFHCYQKAKNRILFVKKRGTSTQKMMFRLSGSRGQMIHYMLRILIFMPNKQGLRNMRSLRKGWRDGIKKNV